MFSKTKKLIDQHQALCKTKVVDWALAEQLAFGSLLLEGNSVRVSGQDSQRGTFPHRHAVIKDQKTEDLHIPLDHLKKDQGKFMIYNSLLSEYGVLAFEFGYSIAQPNALVIWKAQFGDFANSAQIVMTNLFVHLKLNGNE